MIENKQSLKKIFLDIIKPIFKDKGFSYQWEHIAKFQLKTEKYVAMSYYDFLDRKPAIRGGEIRLCLWDVEDIILDIQHPNKDFSSYLTKTEDFLSTVSSKTENSLSEWDELDTEEKVLQIANTVRQYIETDGQKFIDTYSHLPNVLAEMDKLEAEGKLWKEILSGGPEYFFKGLIISKLCNDKNYEKKIDFVDHIFYDKQYGLEDWLSHYEKLKEKLNTLSPLYNL